MQEATAVCVLGSESQNSVSVDFATCCPKSLTCGFFPGFSVVTQYQAGLCSHVALGEQGL